MRKFWLGAAVLLAGCSIGKDLPVAEAQVKQFHAMLDAGQFTQIYRAGAPELRAATPEKDMVAIFDAVHRKLGAFQSATTTGWNDNFNNADHFIVLNQKAKYAHGDAVEEFTYRLSGGKATLAGYHVTSTALITS